MIKVDKNLENYLKLVEPIVGIKKIKLSTYRHPFHAREEHDLIKERILVYNKLINTNK
jgi:hypothetical protein